METDKTGHRPVQPRAAANWGRRITIGAFVVVAASAVGVAGAISGGFGGPGGMGHFGMGPFGMERRLGSALENANATPEQEKKIWAIIDAARGEVRPTMRGFRDTREKIVGILGAPTVDRAAVEKLRQERVAAIDAASKTVTAAVLDAAETLTPEQRAKLVGGLQSRWPHGPR